MTKNEYVWNARNTVTQEIRFMGYYETKKKAEAALRSDEVLLASRRPVDRITAVKAVQERLGNAAEHNLAAVKDAWPDDLPNHAQEVLFLRALDENPGAVKDAVERINGMDEEEITTSRWAILYPILDRISPRKSVKVADWI